MSFSEDRLCSGYICYGTNGGPEYSTDIVVLNSGYEQTNKNWQYARGKWDFGDRKMPQPELYDIIKFFRARGGRAEGFRFKDWADFNCAVTEGILAQGQGTGMPTLQMMKQYLHGVDVDLRVIAKPVTNTTAFFRNGNALVFGSAAGNIALDTTTGLVTFAPDLIATITGITQAANGVVTTSVAHGFTTGQDIYLTGIGGMTQLNGLVANITVLTTTTFSLNMNTTAFSAYISGGNAELFPQPADRLTWSGQFDVPARFDTDHLKYRFDSADVTVPGQLGQTYYYLSQLPLLEIRV